MTPHSWDGDHVFRTLFREIPDEAVPIAYDCFRRYMQLGIEICAETAEHVLTEHADRGSVEGGAVDPSTFTSFG